MATPYLTVEGLPGLYLTPSPHFLEHNHRGCCAGLCPARQSCDQTRRFKPSLASHSAGVVVRTYSYEGEELCDKRMGVFRKSIEAAAMAEGQGFAAIKVCLAVVGSVWVVVRGAVMAAALSAC